MAIYRVNVNEQTGCTFGCSRIRYHLTVNVGLSRIEDVADSASVVEDSAASSTSSA